MDGHADRGDGRARRRGEVRPPGTDPHRVNEGLLTSTRHGRRVLWELTPAGAELLEEGTQRIYGFMRERHPWDGRWLVLSVPIPETQRQLRHRLRTRLTWLGLGSPTSGLWVSPDADMAAAVRAVMRSWAWGAGLRVDRARDRAR